jgi:uncharacterized protein YpmB
LLFKIIIGLVVVASTILFSVMQNQDVIEEVENTGNIVSSVDMLSKNQDIIYNLEVSRFIIHKEQQKSKDITLLNKMQKAIEVALDNGIDEPDCSDMVSTNLITQDECAYISQVDFDFYTIENNNIDIDTNVSVNNKYVGNVKKILSNEGVDYSDGMFSQNMVTDTGLKHEMRYRKEKDESDKNVQALLENDEDGVLAVHINDSLIDGDTQDIDIQNRIKRHLEKKKIEIAKSLSTDSYNEALTENIGYEETLESNLNSDDGYNKIESALSSVSSDNSYVEENTDEYIVDVQLPSNLSSMIDSIDNSIVITENEIKVQEEKLFDDAMTFRDQIDIEYKLNNLRSKLQLYKNKKNNIILNYTN